MEPFTTLTSRVVPLPLDNIDTDQIIPARFLKTIDKAGLGDALFADWRYDAAGRPRPDFVLNQPAAQGAQVLLVGHNFGCGSSREHAAWALLGFGFRAVIGTSFADIFRNNALKNGLLPVVVDPQTHQRLLNLVAEDPAAQVTIDLATQSLRLPDGSQATFPIAAFTRRCLLQGVDELGYLLGLLPQIEGYEARVGDVVRTWAPCQ
jgi:3-isopropylmalate/(R)-2-methylmalate dehydratase small subunit